MEIKNFTETTLSPEIKNSLYYYGMKLKKKNIELYYNGKFNTEIQSDIFVINFVYRDKLNLIGNLGFKIIKQDIFYIVSPNCVAVIVQNNSNSLDFAIVDQVMTFYSLHKFEIEKGDETIDLGTNLKESSDLAFLGAAFKDVILSSTNKLKEKAKYLLERRKMFQNCLDTIEENMVEVRNELSRVKILESLDYKTKVVEIIDSINNLKGKFIDTVELKNNKMFITKKNIIFELEEADTSKKTSEKTGECYYYGDVTFSLSLPGLNVKIEALKEFHLNNDVKLGDHKHCHPHISSSLIPCLGESHAQVEQYKKDFNLSGLIVFLAAIFNSYNYKSPYSPCKFKEKLIKFNNAEEALLFGKENNNLDEGFKNEKFQVAMPFKAVC